MYKQNVYKILSICLLKRDTVCGGHYEGEGQIWRDWNMSGIVKLDGKFPKNQ